MRIVSVAKMVALEKKANENGLGYDQMMENAGHSLSKAIIERCGGIAGKEVLGLVGSGNNGGDTLIALTILQNIGGSVTAYLAKDRKQEDQLIARFIRSGGKVVHVREDEAFDELKSLAYNARIILDGILGTGIKLPLKGIIPDILKMVSANKQDAAVVAVDCPSGVDCDSGAVADEVLQADLTICMAAVKQGMIKEPAIGMMGEIVFADIGLPGEITAELDKTVRVAESDLVTDLLPKRPSNAHKGTFGTCMVIGGSTQYCGAPILAAKAAYRIGAGLVQTAIPGAIYDAVAGRALESTWLILPHNLGGINPNAVPIIYRNMEKATSILIGPGLGLDKETKAFLSEFLAFGAWPREKTIGFSKGLGHINPSKIAQPNFVFDADALRILTDVDGWYECLEKTAVLTPHPGEMAALTRLEISEIQKDRINVTREFASKIGHVVALKGSVTIVANPGGNVTVIPISTAALATAGSGDVLSGMITGLIAQGVLPYDAAVAGCWFHGIAGLAAEKQHGQSASIIASDIIALIPDVLKKKTAC